MATVRFSHEHPGPPHNPGVRELVAAKRKWASSLTLQQAKAGFKGWHERGYLPHRDEPGLTQMVTFHLGDSFPTTLRSEWEALLEIEDNDARRKQLQAYLDKGRGECLLRDPRLAGLVEGAFRFYHAKDYELRAWVVMPNHVHVLFNVGEKPMGRVIADWKQYTAREANRLLKRDGQFWAADYWDTFMRNLGHELQARNYTERNPVKAGLVSAAKDWPWSSARFCDEYGRLVLESRRGANVTERGTSRAPDLVTCCRVAARSLHLVLARCKV
ncbi:MAG TPA: transposase [Candidatus Limnocylindrales bacterium]|nr:transposase [Candidatus Limnocylindrales bacterium]